MPFTANAESAALNRASRTPQRDVGTTNAVAATDTFTLATGNLDSLQSGDVVFYRVAGTGGAGLILGTRYFLQRLTSTTFKLLTAPAGPVLDVTSDQTGSTAVLCYGDIPAGSGVLSSNIVSYGSVAGGGAAADPQG